MDNDEVPDLLDTDQPEAGPSVQYDRRKVPLTLLTGYLGAGKSTLLDYVLTADHGYKIAVCMNDFGDTTDIESKALTLRDPITGEETSTMLSLPNGCLCCSFKDMGIAAIEEMVAAQGGVDWVMVELTGLADPAPIAKDFWSNEEMGDLLLDGVVCVVDSRNILKQLDTPASDGRPSEAQRQVACADLILLNKTDLVNPAQLAEVKNRIHALNSTLRIHDTQQSRVPLDALFNIRAFSVHPDGLDSFQAVNADLANGHSHHVHAGDDHEHDDDGNHDHPPEHADISTTLIPLPTLKASQFDKLNDFLEIVLWSRTMPDGKAAPDILRTKGYVKRDDGSEWILQGVTDIFELKQLKESRDQDGVQMQGKIVFIGRGVDDSIKRTLLDHVGII